MTVEAKETPPPPGQARRVIPRSKRGRVWVLEGARIGDNAQSHALATSLGCGYRTKTLAYNRLFGVPNILLRSSLATLDKANSAELQPLWPEIVISAGRRSVPIARWIRAQSGGHTRIVQIGRPRAPLDWFDLVLTTPQYGLPRAKNVIELPLPLVASPDQPQDHSFWQRRFKGFPRPWIGVLAGGAGPSYRFDEAAAHKLAALASRTAHDLGGALLVSSSPRTGRVQSKTIERALVVPSYVHHWTGPEENPHQAILALADRFIVTCDSVSMIAEACATGKPVELFKLPAGRWQPKWNARSGVAEKLARLGLMSPPRDVAQVHRRLIKEGRVSWCGQPASNTPKLVSDENHRHLIQIVQSWLSGTT